MKELFKGSIKIKLSIVILIVLIISCLIIGFFFFKSDNPKLLSVLGSLFAGIIVAIIQFLIAWQDYTSSERLKSLMIKHVLINRDDRNYYEQYIRNAKEEVCVMGVTAARFMEHFANDDEDASENSKVLLSLMREGLVVKLLLPQMKYLKSSDKGKFQTSEARFKSVKEKHPHNFKVKYFSHIPAQSIFMVDDECVIGPVFPKVSSRFTPALHIKNKSPFAEKYIKYFNNEWDEADEL